MALSCEASASRISTSIPSWAAAARIVELTSSQNSGGCIGLMNPTLRLSARAAGGTASVAASRTEAVIKPLNQLAIRCFPSRPGCPPGNGAVSRPLRLGHHGYNILIESGEVYRLRRRPTIAAAIGARATPNPSCRRRSASTTCLAAACIVVDADLRRHDDKIGRAHYQTIRLILGVALVVNLPALRSRAVARRLCAGWLSAA